MKKYDYDGMYNSKTKHPLGPLNWIRNKEIVGFFNKIAEKKKMSILDLGCGKAYLDIELAKRGHDVTGIDLSNEAVAFAKMMARKNNVSERTRFVQSDIRKLKLTSTYDVVICSEVIEHFKDDTAIVKLIYNYLKNGGYSIITVPYNPKLWNPLDVASAHYHRYSLRQISGLLKKNNLMVKKTRVYGFPLIRIFRFFYNKTLVKKENVKKDECEIEPYGYAPKGSILRLYILLSPILFRVFYLDNLFNFTRMGIGIVVLAKKIK